MAATPFFALKSTLRNCAVFVWPRP